MKATHGISGLSMTACGALGWLSGLNIWLLISAQVMIAGSWDWAPSQPPCWAWKLHKILCLPFPLPLSHSCSCSLSKKKKKRDWWHVTEPKWQCPTWDWGAEVCNPKLIHWFHGHQEPRLATTGQSTFYHFSGIKWAHCLLDMSRGVQ